MSHIFYLIGLIFLAHEVRVLFNPSYMKKLLRGTDNQVMIWIITLLDSILTI